MNCSPVLLLATQVQTRKDSAQNISIDIEYENKTNGAYRQTGENKETGGGGGKGKKREHLYLLYIVLTGHLDHRIFTPLPVSVGSCQVVHQQSCHQTNQPQLPPPLFICHMLSPTLEPLYYTLLSFLMAFLSWGPCNCRQHTRCSTEQKGVLTALDLLTVLLLKQPRMWLLFNLLSIRGSRSM